MNKNHRSYRLAKALEALGYYVFGRICSNSKCNHRSYCNDRVKFCCKCGAQMTDDEVENICSHLEEVIQYAEGTRKTKPQKVY